MQQDQTLIFIFAFFPVRLKMKLEIRIENFKRPFFFFKEDKRNIRSVAFIGVDWRAHSLDIAI